MNIVIIIQIRIYQEVGKFKYFELTITTSSSLHIGETFIYTTRNVVAVKQDNDIFYIQHYCYAKTTLLYT